MLQYYSLAKEYPSEGEHPPLLFEKRVILYQL